MNLAPLKKLSVVVPCYNEGKNIPLLFSRFEEMLANYSGPISVEVIIVDNGSTDESRQIFEDELSKLRNQNIRVHRVEKNQGYGFGILSGLRVAEGDVLAWTHADMQTDPNDVIRALEVFSDHYSKFGGDTRLLVKGHRIKRRFGEWAFTFGMSIVSSVILGRMLFDVNAQPKLFHRDFFRSLSNPPHDFSLDLYLLYKAKTNKIALKMIDVIFQKRIHGESHWASSTRTKYRTIARTIRYIFGLKKAIELEGSHAHHRPSH